MGRVSNQAYFCLHAECSLRGKKAKRWKRKRLKDVSLRLSRVLQAKYEPKKLAMLEEMRSSDIEGAATYAPTVWKTTACSFLSNVFKT